MPMVDTFTSLQFIRYVYRESDSTEKLILEECLLAEPEMQIELKQLLAAKNALPDVLFSAHPDSLKKIMAYSKTGPAR